MPYIADPYPTVTKREPTLTTRGPAQTNARTNYGTPGSRNAGASSAGGGMTTNYQTWLEDIMTPRVNPTPTSPTQQTQSRGDSSSALPSQQNMRDPGEFLRNIVDSQYKAIVAGLQNSYKANLGQLEQQQANIANRYMQARTDQDVQSMLLNRRLKESLGASGVASGDILGQNVSLLAANRGALGDLTSEEQQQYDLLETMKTQLRQALEADIAAAKQNAEAQRMQALVDSQQYQDQLALQAAPYTGELWGQPTLQAQELMRAASGSQTQGNDLNDIYKMLQIQQLEQSMSENPYMENYMNSLGNIFSVGGMPIPYGSTGWTTAANNAEQYIQSLLSAGAVNQDGANLLRSIYLY